MKEIRAFVRLNMGEHVVHALSSLGCQDFSIAEVRRIKQGLPRGSYDFSVVLGGPFEEAGDCGGLGGGPGGDQAGGRGDPGAAEIRIILGLEHGGHQGEEQSASDPRLADMVHAAYLG